LPPWCNLMQPNRKHPMSDNSKTQIHKPMKPHLLCSLVPLGIAAAPGL
jgi:hypothetical protein